MENNNGNKGFQYTYSAKEQAEIKRIREKYAPNREIVEDKMERLRRMDAAVTAKSQAAALSFGIVGVLTLGAGMSLCMSDFAEILGAHQDMAMIIGVALGLVGGVIAALAYPIYKLFTKRLKRKIAPEVIRLTDELMK